MYLSLQTVWCLYFLYIQFIHRSHTIIYIKTYFIAEVQENQDVTQMKDAVAERSSQAHKTKLTLNDQPP